MFSRNGAYCFLPRCRRTQNCTTEPRDCAAGRLQFSTDIAAAVAHGPLQFIAVGTPSDEDGSADLQHVLAAARSIAEHMDSFKIVINKSTVPVGTAQKVHAVLEETLHARGIRCGFSVVSNPEFLKEGVAIKDFMDPDRIVLGCDSDAAGQQAREVLSQLYAPFNTPQKRVLHMDVRSAELTKYAANAMLATRISFMNELAILAEHLKVDIEAVREGLGSDRRIGPAFLNAGCGYGGSCLPKDIRALLSTAREHQQQLHILQAVEAVNRHQKNVLLQKITTRFGDDLSGHTFAIWGLAFKPNTDDMREAPSRSLIRALLEHGATVVAYDPVATAEAQRALTLDLQDQAHLQAYLHFATDPLNATQNADALVLMTEWEAFKNPDFSTLKAKLRHAVLFDGRNLYDPSELRMQGFEYHGIGRLL
jgi:UDPglucose 6-dehydrogenase